MEILDRKINPEFKLVTDLKMPSLKRITLSNGLPVHILNGGSQELTKLDVVVKAGVTYAKHKLYAPLTSLMLNEGTVSKTAQQLAEVFDYYGAYFNPVTEKDNAFVTLFSLNKHLKYTLPAFYDALMNSSFPDKELEVLLQRRLNNFLIESEKTSFLAREAFFEQIFGENHPYGVKSIKEHYSQVGRNGLFSFYQDNYQSGDFELLLSGQITNEVLTQIEQVFGAINVSSKPQVFPEKIWKNNDKLHVIERNDAVQSSIRMGLPTIRKTHPDYLGLKILTTILGGYFGSRLMKNIREEKGYTYGIHAMLVSFMHSGYIVIAADVKAEHAKDAIAEIKKEIEKLQTQPITAGELALVKNYMMGDLLQMLDGPISISEAYKATMQFGYDFTYFENLKNRILNISPEILQNLAQKYFVINNMSVVVAGKY